MKALKSALRFASLLDQCGYPEVADTVDQWIRVANNTGINPPPSNRDHPSFLDSQDRDKKGYADGPFLHNPIGKRHTVGIPNLAPGDSYSTQDIEYVSIPAAIALEKQGHPVTIHWNPEDMNRNPEFRSYIDRQRADAVEAAPGNDAAFTPSSEIYPSRPFNDFAWDDDGNETAPSQPSPWRANPKIQNFLSTQDVN